MHDFTPFLPLVGSLLGLLVLCMAFRAGRRRRLIENLPLRNDRRFHRPGRTQRHGRIGRPADKLPRRAAVRRVPVERRRALVAHHHESYTTAKPHADADSPRKRLDHRRQRRRDDPLLSARRLRRRADSAEGRSWSRARSSTTRSARAIRSTTPKGRPARWPTPTMNVVSSKKASRCTRRSTSWARPASGKTCRAGNRQDRHAPMSLSRRDPKSKSTPE